MFNKYIIFTICALSLVFTLLMLIRIVKMQFTSNGANLFEPIFLQVKPQILQQEGCLCVELWRDTLDPNTYFTYSLWQSPQDLAQYRASALFLQTWRQVKPLFAAPAQAWSVEKLA